MFVSLKVQYFSEMFWTKGRGGEGRRGEWQGREGRGGEGREGEGRKNFTLFKSLEFSDLFL